MVTLKTLLGPNSYYGIVDSIVTKLNESLDVKNLSFTNRDLILSTINKLNESSTPVMDLKEFVTNAEKIAPSDTLMSDLLKFIRKETTSGDLNYLVNIAKEEHFKEMKTLNIPNVEATIAEIKQNFEKPASELEQMIRNGLFDSIKSELMDDIKETLGLSKSKNKITKKTEAVIEPLNENVISYCPIGVNVEDVKNNRIILLTESDMISYSRANDDFERIQPEEYMTINIPDSYKKMMNAVNTLPYNPSSNTFSPNQKWDFNLEIDPIGDIYVWADDTADEKKLLAKEELPGFLMESIDVYSKSVPGFNRIAFTEDADNLIMLAENHSKLIKIDNLKTIRNLNENTYVVLDNRMSYPKVVAGTGFKQSQKFNNFVELMESCNKVVSSDLKPLFESQLVTEAQFNADKFETVQELKQEQTEINQLIQENDSLIAIAEENSPAMQKLQENASLLNERLEANLLNLTNYVNHHSLYGN